MTEHPAYGLAAHPGAGLPIVLDSPHSWREPPADFQTVAPLDRLLTACDAFVDELYADVAELGGALMWARFPRYCIDVNRARDDIDPALLDGPWPGAINPTGRSRRGMGLIRRSATPGVPMYAAPLPVAEVLARIDRYYDPYMAALAGLIQERHQRFGQLWHINCHSMKSRANAMNTDAGQARPDFVVSDLLGTTAEPEFTNWAAETLTGFGYNVSINHPYRGAEIIRRAGDPSNRRHSIQIEVNRGLYMDEAAIERHAGFAKLKADLTGFLVALCRYVERRLGT